MTEKRCINCLKDVSEDITYFHFKHGYMCHECGKKLIEHLSITMEWKND